MRKLLAITLLLLGACGQQDSGSGNTSAEGPAGEGVAVIYTVNYPLAWMARTLAGDAARVIFPAPAGEDPAFWQPDTATLLQFQQADLVLLNGANYARWVAGVSLPASRLLDTSAAYRDQLLAVEAAPVHSHGPGGEHSHGDLAFTTWLDLELARGQLQAVAAALQQLLPGEAGAIAKRLQVLDSELGALDARLVTLGRQLGAAPLLYSHPVYQYLQRRYQLNGRALHWEPDQFPEEAHWSELESLLQTHPARLMLWEAAPGPEVTERLAALGVTVVVFAPMANRPGQGDFKTGMEANIAALEAAAVTAAPPQSAGG